MRTVILVPRRNDYGHRDRLWAWCRDRWQRYFPDLPIYEGHHDEGPFSRAAGINRAAKLADLDGRWDIALVIDSDVFLKVSQVRTAIATASETGRVTWAHRRWREFHQDWTMRTLDKGLDFGAELDARDMDVLVARTNPLSWSCCIAIPRAIWDGIGGFDERFRGWGFEDMAFQSLVVSLYGHERIEGDVLNLWHPRSSERIVKGQPRSTASEAYITNARLGRRYMLAARRDHGVHDRPDPADEEERQRDIANLMTDDRKWSAEAKRHGLPDWDDWWPTLEELRDGAKSARMGPEPDATVTVVVHTGGDPARWPDRREYLRESLRSLRDRLDGPIVQWVIYDVWGDASIRDEIAAMAPAPFYVVGPKPRDWRPGHPWSRAQLWRYLGAHAQGDFIFGTEDDFIYDRPVDLGPIIDTLRSSPNIRQIALLRAPYFHRELEAGGILEQHPDRYVQVSANGHSRIEHRDHFTNNPSLFPKSLTRVPFPATPNSEVRFAETLNRDPLSRFAYWGDGEPWVHHIGEVRAGEKY